RSNKILILVTGDPTASVVRSRGGFPAIIREAIGGAWRGDYQVVDARSGELASTGSDAAAVIITGSAAHVQDREPRVVAAGEWLGGRVQERPVLGLCLGHQLLAQAVGGELQRNPSGREIGTVEVERVADDPLFDGIERRFSAQACHLDTVV